MEIEHLYSLVLGPMQHVCVRKLAWFRWGATENAVTENAWLENTKRPGYGKRNITKLH